MTLERHPNYLYSSKGQVSSKSPKHTLPSSESLRDKEKYLFRNCPYFQTPGEDELEGTALGHILGHSSSWQMRHKSQGREKTQSQTHCQNSSAFTKIQLAETLSRATPCDVEAMIKKTLAETNTSGRNSHFTKVKD